jgi:hypothetical protein
MDIAITRSVVDASGDRIGLPAQTIHYRLSRVKTGGGWHTTLSLGVPDGTSREQTARNPFFGGRVEFDHNGRFAMFDNTGREVPIPAAMATVVPRFGDFAESLQIISLAADSRQSRVDEVEAKYGRPTGRVRGLAQYLRRSGEDVEELLVDVALAVPVELNVMRGDALKGRLVFDYAEQPGRGVVRRGTRSEAVLNDDGDRAVTTTAFANLVVERER